ncbi:peptidase M20 [Haloterrigena turkmenica DSM 5511]|uniref:Peptidase M20 n=1 Tax=Haloterrigena turkmenica (strain ATCC 51198 / DSM 5511 / JCM 9101 / NCIMB 13204 / VKM B-1734 / 4k) TaxID=543526 RepID=D2RQK0_HALTV|nr:M20/M25/M40 family metallo-hydrolase [Haloterrigena turkmenica]ADB62377.1 peptidase M20 [Haloterrigena turkmenica DSM 5511]
MEVVDLTRELVSIPSHEDETAAGDYIEAWLRRETDADVHRDGAGNVIARKGSGGETLALVGHHDVVEPAASQIAASTDGDSEYALEERDGRLYGRGAADMKGAVAAAMLAFRDSEVPPASSGETTSGNATPGGELIFASFVGEEVGGVGARHAIDRGFAPDYAVVGEGSTGYSSPGVTDVAIAHKGRRGSTITARGEAAHASEVGAGENAIYRATDAVDRVRDLEPPSVEVAGETLEGSLAVTEIEGGSAMNVVPDRCELTVDERTVPGERAALERVTDLEGVEWTVDQDLPPMRCDDEAFAEAVLEAADAAQPGSPELITKPHATDAGWLAAAGAECVICGAAEPGEAHTEDESVSLEVLERCWETYRRLAASWLN